ncbi:MAG: lysine 2,3-aminomutase, partial [Alcanivorax sp.]|nr:lysine 2,3-aminomutase [Alcanivorax sp.]
MPETNAVIPLHQSTETQFEEPRRFKVFTARQLDKIEPLKRLDDETRFAMEVVANVLPFRVNEYVIDELIDWD